MELRRSLGSTGENEPYRPLPPISRGKPRDVWVVCLDPESGNVPGLSVSVDRATQGQVSHGVGNESLGRVIRHEHFDKIY